MDWADKDPIGLHKFLWEHHLGYARTYAIETRFGYDNFNETRQIFFRELREHLIEAGVNPDTDIDSVFEVGCSLGYLLRYLETDVFPAAARLEGVDIDRKAVEEGLAYLHTLGSKVRLTRGDMEDLDDMLEGEIYDIMVCAGTLLYLDYEHAEALVERMFRHTGVLVALAGLAYEDCDNRDMEASVSRASDCTFIHNIDAMVASAGGQVVARRWEGGKMVDGNTVYFVFARPA